MKQLPFIPGQLYKRSELHDQYGGNRQSGITTTTHHPYIFIFSGKTGSQYGYLDGWDNEDVFTYTGEGQEGDMQFTRGNLALREHLNQDRRVFLFEAAERSFVKFVCELEFFDFDYFETPDRKGQIRIGIKFFFKRMGAFIPVSRDQLSLSLSNEYEPAYALSLEMPNETERRGLVTSRVGQGMYRKRMIHRWKYKCAVTGFSKLDVLIASHIVPWAESSPQERLDVHNGILLSPTYDALFDRHLISFMDDGRILLSDSIQRESFSKIGVTGKEQVKELSSYNHEYLQRHRMLFEVNG